MKKILFFIVSFIAASNLLFAQAPTITSFSPASGAAGTLVTINGTNLSSPTAFTIGGVSAIIISKTSTTLVGMVMPGVTTGTVSVSNVSGSAFAEGNCCKIQL